LADAQQYRKRRLFTERCYAERGYGTVCRPSVRLSVCLSVTFRYRDRLGWNTSKIISRPNSLRPLLGLTTTIHAFLCQNVFYCVTKQHWEANDTVRTSSRLGRAFEPNEQEQPIARYGYGGTV